MKKKVLIIIGILLLVLIALLTWFRSYTKSHSPVATAAFHQNGTDITVTYCQPYKKGRLIFGDETSGALQPYGKYWRIGANEATVFESNKDLMVAYQHLKAGKYSIYAYPGKDSWEIVFNADFDRWGVPAPDSEKDILKATVMCANNSPISDQLFIKLTPVDSNNLTMVIHWDQTLVTLPIMIH